MDFWVGLKQAAFIITIMNMQGYWKIQNRPAFSLIQLIIGMTVIGILVAAVTMGIGTDLRFRGVLATYQSEIQAVQTAVDSYYAEHDHYPTLDGQPQTGMPKAIAWDALVPEFMTKRPSIDLYYWLDDRGQVWASAHDAPINFAYDNGAFTWGSDPGAEFFEIFQKASGAQVSAGNKQMILVDRFSVSEVSVDNGIATYTPDQPFAENATYFIVSHGRLGVTPPVGRNYSGHPLPPQTDWSWLTKIKGNDPDKTTLDEVADLRLTAGSEQITLNWTDPASGDFDAVLISWSPGNGYAEVPAGTETHTIDNLVNGTTYEFVVQTRTSSGRVSPGIKIAGTPKAAVVMFAGGRNHSLLLREDGTVWSWGRNEHGQVGDDTYIDRDEPVLVFEDAITITSGRNHSVALASDGRVYTWGSNSSGELGNDSTRDRAFPFVVRASSGSNLLSDIIAIDSSDLHTLALRQDGTVWGWGYNRDGRLGNGTTENQTRAVQVRGPSGNGYLTDIIAIAAGGDHSLALRADGTVWSWGNNAYGQLGDNTTTRRTTPVQVRGVGGSGYLTNVVAIAAGDRHSLALLQNGTVVAWGANAEGQIGDNGSSNRLTPRQVRSPHGSGNLTNVVEIAAGHRHSFAITGDGNLWAWGTNGSGQLGDGTTITRRIPVQVHGANDGEFLTNVLRVYAAQNHAFAITADGTLWAWGSNTYGQLGDQTTELRTRPVQINP